MSDAAKAGQVKVLTFHEIAGVHGAATRDWCYVEGCEGEDDARIDVDAILPMLGFVSDIGPLAEWGFTVEKDEIVVNEHDGDGPPRDLAAGDITTYPGKLKLIASGIRRGGDRGESGGALDLSRRRR